MIFGKQINKPILWGLLWCSLFMQGPLETSYGCEHGTNTTQGIPRKEELSRLNQTIENLAQTTIHTRTFHETYYSGMLTTPTHKEGTLTFSPPDRLEKHVQVPTQESFIITGNSLLYTNPDREISQTFSLEDYPALATLIEGLRALFNGDQDTLREFFEVSMIGTPEAWGLNLSPRMRSDEDGVDCIRLAGEQAHLHTILIQETNGDRSELQLDLQMP